MTERLRGWLATVGQIIWYPAFWLLAHVICHTEVSNRLSLPANQRVHFVIAANHQSQLDAFIITGILGPRYRRLWPYRYITANQYLYAPRFAWLLWPLGGFPAYSTKLELWGLDRAVRILKAHQTVCIFPEGQRASPHKIIPKRGVTALANLPDVYIIPIHLQWIKRRRLVKLSIGPAQPASGQTPQQIMDTIYNL